MKNFKIKNNAAIWEMLISIVIRTFAANIMEKKLNVFNTMLKDTKFLSILSEDELYRMEKKFKEKFEDKQKKCKFCWKTAEKSCLYSHKIQFLFEK